ncbi:AI-2E family transporter [Patescibacteria group bacterium]
MSEEKILDISWKTILRISIAAFCFYILYLTRDILVWFLFALIVSVLFNPVIDFLQKKGVPRTLSVVFVYFSVFTFFSFLIYFTAAGLIVEIQNFLQSFPQYFEKISPSFQLLGLQTFESIEVFMATLNDTLVKMSGNLLNALFSIFGGIFSTMFVIIAAIFLSLEEGVIERSLRLLFPKKYEAYTLTLWKDCQRKVSGWFLSRIIACFFVGVASYTSFLVLNVEYSLSLGLIAGVLNFVPYIGPLITAILIFLVVCLDSVSKAIFVLLAFGLIQLIENSILTPALLKKFIGLPPALLLVTLAMGATLWGVLGAILCVPLAGILFEFLRDFLKKRREEGAVVV